MHGQYIKSIARQFINEEDMFSMSREDLKAETESGIVAAQDQAIQTKYHTTKILHTQTESRCRIRQQFDETTEHIISACPILVKEQYIQRHDSVYVELHVNICKEIWVKLGKKHL